jgi:hypothetical protein
LESRPESGISLLEIRVQLQIKKVPFTQNSGLKSDLWPQSLSHPLSHPLAHLLAQQGNSFNQQLKRQTQRC